MPDVSRARGAGFLRGGNSLDKSKTLSSKPPSSPRRLLYELVRLLKLPEGSNILATGANELFTPVMGGMNSPMGIGGPSSYERGGLIVTEIHRTMYYN